MGLLIHLIEKDQTFVWGPKTKCIFQSLKVSFTIVPLLIHVDLYRLFVLETSIFDFALGTIFSQLEKDNSTFFILQIFVFKSFIPLK
jgi:hypothetical protein